MSEEAEGGPVDWTDAALHDFFQHHVANAFQPVADICSCRLVCKRWHSLWLLPKLKITRARRPDFEQLRHMLNQTQTVEVKADDDYLELHYRICEIIALSRGSLSSTRMQVCQLQKK